MRDRHGRTLRADGDRMRRPVDGFRVRDRRRFRTLVLDALATLPPPLRDALGDSRLVVEDVPPEGSLDLVTWRDGVLTVHRRAVEGRALGRADLQRLVRTAAGREVAAGIGRVEDFADLFDDWDDADDWDDPDD